MSYGTKDLNEEEVGTLKEYTDYVTAVLSEVEWNQMRAVGPLRNQVLKGFGGLGKKWRYF